MGAPAAGRVARSRPRWRAYLLLARVSNVPTVWSNTLAGMLAAGAVLDQPLYLRVAAAMSCFYTGGMFLNDAFDAGIDARVRPERPLPAGDVSRREVFLIGAGLLGAGVLVLSAHPAAAVLSLLLAAAIVFYDARHKGVSFAPIVMGLCRGLVYTVAAAAAGGVSTAALAGAAVMATYVTGLTLVAKASGANARWLVPLLIAAIALVDAVFILAITADVVMAAAAAACFPATLALQRVIPGD